MPEKGYDLYSEAVDEAEILSREIIELRGDLNRMRGILLMPLTSHELRLVDKNCDWIAFKHAWSAIVKHRLNAVDGQKEPG